MLYPNKANHIIAKCCMNGMEWNSDNKNVLQVKKKIGKMYIIYKCINYR